MHSFIQVKIQTVGHQKGCYRGTFTN